MQLSTSVPSYHHYYKINAHKLFTIDELQFLLVTILDLIKMKCEFTSCLFAYVVFVTVCILQKSFLTFVQFKICA